MVASNPSVIVGDFLASMLSTKLITVGSFIVTFLVVFIVLKIIIGLLRKIRDIPGIGFIDGLLGGAYSVIKTAIFVCVLFWIATILTGIPGFGDAIANFLKSDMKLDSETFGIAKFVYLNNPIDNILKNVNFNDLLSQVINK